MRYFMLDRILSFNKSQDATAIKNITLSEDVLSDHFPELPIYPGAFIIESAAQLGGFLVEMSVNTPASIRRAMMVQVDQAKFYQPTEPGDQLLLNAKIDNLLDDAAARVMVNVSCSEKKVARALITFVLKDVSWEKIHEQRRSLYRIWTKTIKGFPEIL